MKKFAFPKKLRLLANDELKAVIAKRRRFSDNRLVVYTAPNGRDYARLGVSAGRAVGGAVIRNRFKRLVREAFRQSREQLAIGIDYVVIGLSKGARELTFEGVKESFLKLSKRIDY